MADIDLIPREDHVPCPPNQWTMILPADWDREYFGVGFGPMPPTCYIGTLPGDITVSAQISPNQTRIIQWEMWAERQRTLVTQEWWIQPTGGVGSVPIVVWSVRRINRRARKSDRVLLPSGLVAPGGLDDLSGYDPVKMETLLSEMRRQTKRLANAQP